jgi:hypothetical protein
VTRSLKRNRDLVQVERRWRQLDTGYARRAEDREILELDRTHLELGLDDQRVPNHEQAAWETARQHWVRMGQPTRTRIPKGWIIAIAVGLVVWAVVLFAIVPSIATPRSAPDPTTSSPVGDVRPGPAGPSTPATGTSGRALSGTPSLDQPPDVPVLGAPGAHRAEVARVTAPPPESAPLDQVTLSGIATHMGNHPAAGPRYLALPMGPGWRVRICGPASCDTVTSTDAGPEKWLQRPPHNRIADLSTELFEQLCAPPKTSLAYLGKCNISWTVERRP